MTITNIIGGLSLRRSLKTFAWAITVLMLLPLVGCSNLLKSKESFTMNRMSSLSNRTKINMELIRETRQKWKIVFQSFKHKEDKYLIDQKVQSAYSSTIMLVNHLDAIGFTAQLDNYQVEPKDLYWIALAKNLKEMEVPKEVLSRMSEAWVQRDKQVALQYIRQHGGVSTCLRRALSKLEKSNPVDGLSLDAIFQTSTSGQFTAAIMLPESCRKVAINCAGLFAAAALLCAVDGDFCMGATLWALALCALYGGLEGCPIF